MDAAGGDVCGVGVCDAEDVGACDRLCGETCSHDVADASADAGCCAAVGFDGGGVVVCFDLDADGVFIVEGDDAGVVYEDAECPVDAVSDEFVGCGGNGGLEEVVDGDGAVGVDGVVGAVGPVDWVFCVVV